MRRKIQGLAIALLMSSGAVSQVCCAEQQYKEDWDDLNRYPQAEWLNELKFGMYFHWNYNTIGGSDGWYGKRMYDEEHKTYTYHKEHFGDPAEFGYKDFEKMFTAEKFSAKEWLDNLEAAGGKFMVGMAVHHDGFDMYDSSFTEWNSVDKPPHIDVMGELATESRKRGLKFGATSHLAWNWKYFSDYMYPDKFDAAEAPDFYNIHDPEGHASMEFAQQWYNRTTELIDKYKLDFLWFDFGTGDKTFRDNFTCKLTAYYYNKSLEWNKTVAMASKVGFSNDKSKIHDCENGKFGYIHYPLWMADCSMNSGWFYLAANEARRKANSTADRGRFWLHQLIDITSKNGTLLLNLGPKADGSWPEEYKNELFKTGEWLKVNGEAIYYTTPWHRYGEGDIHDGDASHYHLGRPFTANDIRFTRTKDALYAIVCGSKSGQINIRSLGTDDIADLQIKRITRLDSKAKVEWTQGADAVTITMSQADTHPFGTVYKIEGKGLFPQREGEYFVAEKEFECKDAVSARISLEGEGILAISEVLLIEDRRHVVALESSSMSSQSGGCVVERASDTHATEHLRMETTAMTQREKNPSMEFVFKKPTTIYKVQIFPEITHRAEFLSKGVVEIFDKDGKSLARYRASELLTSANQ